MIREMEELQTSIEELLDELLETIDSEMSSPDESNAIEESRQKEVASKFFVGIESPRLYLSATATVLDTQLKLFTTLVNHRQIIDNKKAYRHACIALWSVDQALQELFSDLESDEKE